MSEVQSTITVHVYAGEGWRFTGHVAIELASGIYEQQFSRGSGSFLSSLVAESGPVDGLIQEQPLENGTPRTPTVSVTILSWPLRTVPMLA